MHLKTGFLVVVLFLISCTFALTPRTPQLQRETSVLIQTPCGMGTGVITGDHHILTAYHVVDEPDCLPIWVTTEDGTVREATVETIVATADLARLHTEGRSLQTATIGPITPNVAAPVVGERVCEAPSYPYRDRVCGTVTSVDFEFLDMAIAFTLPAVGGNSGSGLYDTKGRLVGIVTRRSAMGGRATMIPSWLVE